MKQVTLYVEGQKTCRRVYGGSVQVLRRWKTVKVSEIPVPILSKEDYADALDKMYHGTKNRICKDRCVIVHAHR